MTTENSVKPPKKKRSTRWWIGGALFVLLMLFVWQLLAPSAPIVVSPQTTYVAAPLRPNGLPDYEQYVLQRSREGVTPENNAAVLLWQALWPGELQPRHYGVMAKELGLDEIPSADDSLQPFSGEENRQRLLTWLRERQADGETVEDPVGAVIDGAMSRPWTGAEIPPLAVWVAENEKTLDLIVAASRRPRYYSPSPSLIDGSDTMLIAILLPNLQGLREAARALSARAMWHLGEGRPDQAWEDLLAIYRLARLTTQGPTLVDQLVAMSLDGVACEATAALLGGDDLSNELVLRVQQDLAELERFSSVVDILDQMERLQALDVVMHLRSHGVDILTDGRKMSEPADKTPIRPAFDWGVVLQDMNHWYDRLVAASRIPERSARAQALTEFEDDLDRARDSVSQPYQWIPGFFSRRARSRMISKMLANVMLPTVGAATTAEDRTDTVLELTRLAAGLAVYRAEHGAYPEKLEDLVPDVLAKLPVDLYNAKPFIYRRDGEGYLLYSAGEDGADDGGSHEQWGIAAGRALDDLPDAEAETLRQQIAAGADDIAVRVPRPALKIPAAATP